MKELRDEKKEQIQSGAQRLSQNLLDLVVEAGEPDEKNSQPLLLPDAVMGNIFILLFAGHEANVNTLLFAIVLLACYPNIQKDMQSDIDRITQTWSYDDEFMPLMKSMVGAVINETLRLYSVVPVLAKTTHSAPQTIILSGKSHHIPPNTVILINKSAVHRNPKFWPSRPTNPAAGKPSALRDFDPKQWLPITDNDSSEFLSPVDGSFLAFGDGSRGCLGQNFGQAELCAFLARLFKSYSVELVVDDVRVEDSEDVKEKKWKETRDRVEKDMSSHVEFYMSLRLANQVPVRFVKRGEEVFANFHD
jgi:cytochrome P450